LKFKRANYEVSEHLQQLIEEKVRKLGTFHDRIISAELFLKIGEKRSRQSLEQTVELNIQVPSQILHTEDHSDTFEKSLQAAVDKMRKQLIKHKEHMRPYI